MSLPANPNAAFYPPDGSIPTQTPLTDLEAIYVYEMLGAVYSSDYYLVMDSQGTRYLQIGTIGAPNQGGLRNGINTYIQANLGNSQIYQLRLYIAQWNVLKLASGRIESGMVGAGISGYSDDPRIKRELLLGLVKGLLPAKTEAEYNARNNAKGGVSSVSGSGPSNSSYVEIIR